MFVIGGGAAGISMALQLIETLLKVVLLGSGGMTSPDAAAQFLYAGENVNILPLEVARRLLGGSTKDGTVPWIGSTSKRALGCRAAAGL